MLNINVLADFFHHPTQQLNRFTHFGTTKQQSPHWLQKDAQNSSPKLPLPLRQLSLPSNTPIPWPTPHHPKQHLDPIISILTRHTHTDRQTDQPTDGIGDRSIPLALTLAILIESDTLKSSLYFVIKIYRLAALHYKRLSVTMTHVK